MKIWGLLLMVPTVVMGQVPVQGYIRQGEYVEPVVRSAPDRSTVNNYSGLVYERSPYSPPPVQTYPQYPSYPQPYVAPNPYPVQPAESYTRPICVSTPWSRC